MLSVHTEAHTRQELSSRVRRAKRAVTRPQTPLPKWAWEGTSHPARWLAALKASGTRTAASAMQKHALRGGMGLKRLFGKSDLGAASLAEANQVYMKGR